MPGLGIYIKWKEKDFRENPFVYLKIIGMEYDPDTEGPCFYFKAIKKSDTPSKILIDKLPSENKNKLFSAIEVDLMIKILREIGEKPTEEWLSFIKEVKISGDWRDYLWEGIF